jgi:DMSO/TMAO reductase YedYZ molybdopterin-dependent catalytic subunit
MAASNKSRAVGVLIASMAVATAAQAGPVSSQMTVSGAVASPTTYNVTSLSAVTPTTTLQATYTAGGSPITDTYTGTTLYNLLQVNGLVSPPVKNGALQNYVVAVGSDNYQAVISLGEIAPNFGNQTDLIAYSDTKGQLGPSGPDGFARVVVPGDIAGGRYVSNLTALYVGTAPAVAGIGGGISSQFAVSGNVKTPTTYNLASLSALPSSTETVTYHQGSTPVTDTYTGVSLWTLLSDVGILTDPKIKNDILRDYVVVTGSDGYEAVFSLGEIDPAFGDQDDLVAYADTLGQLGIGGSDGFTRMVVPGDYLGGRYVSNITSIEVIDATVPEPSALSLFALSLAGLAGWRVRGVKARV